MPNQFKDFNFKLAVINELMYNQGVINPLFRRRQFLEDQGITPDPERDEWEIIPEVRAYFEQLEIPAEMLATVEEIYQDGGDEIYMEVVEMWDGEDDKFNITSTDDLALLPNLKKITLFYDDAEAMVPAFQAKGIEAEYL